MPRLCRGICQPAERVWKMEPKRIVLDVDTGTDDAIALMTALLAPQLKVEAICTVHGNTTVENTTANTLKAAYAVGRTDVPVYPGAAGPMVKRLIPSRAIPVPEPILSGTAQIDGVTVAMNPDELPLPVSPQPGHLFAVFHGVHLTMLFPLAVFHILKIHPARAVRGPGKSPAPRAPGSGC